MTQLHLSDEVLMAFADGELDEQMVASVELAIASDPAIAGRVAGFLRSRRLVRSAFPEETAADVSPALRAGVQALIDRFEPPARQAAPSRLGATLRAPFTRQRPRVMALAASIAGLALAVSGYMVGRQHSPLSGAAGAIAHLADPQVEQILSGVRSGQEQDLPFGSMRVISTFRVANGALCREFRLQTAPGALGGVACHDGAWRITFAVAETTPQDGYVPSDSSSPLETYLQNAGAGEPLVEAAEIEALRGARSSP